MKTILCYIAIAVIVITTLLVVPAIVPPTIMTMETIDVPSSISWMKKLEI